MGGFRFNAGCCCTCKCTWKNNDWDIPGDPWEWSNNTNSTSNSYQVVEDDGTPITCKYKIKPNRKPCLEWEYQVDFAQGTEWDNWSAGIFFGETYPDWVFHPNGNDHNLRYRVDARVMYSEIRMDDGELWETQDEIMDASIPNQTFLGPRFGCVLLLKQADNYWYFPGAFFQGVGKEPPDFSYNTGDWAWYEAQLGNTLAYASCFTTGRYSVDDSIKPNLADGAEPIYFGWSAGNFASQNPIFALKLFSSYQVKTRIDGLCVNLTDLGEPWNPEIG